MQAGVWNNGEPRRMMSPGDDHQMVFLTRNDGFKYSATMLSSSGLLNTPKDLSSSNFCCNSTSLSLEYRGTLPFRWGGSTFPMLTTAVRGPNAPLYPLNEVLKTVLYW